MDANTYERWRTLHQRFALGIELTATERLQYEAGCHELDADERLDGNLARLRELRESIRAAEGDQKRLQEQEAELDARIRGLERSLDQRTRQLLGIGN